MRASQIPRELYSARELYSYSALELYIVIVRASYIVIVRASYIVIVRASYIVRTGHKLRAKYLRKMSYIL